MGAVMSKFHLHCSCINCRRQLTVQSLAEHFRKCSRLPPNVCIQCGAVTFNETFCSRSCRTIFNNQKRKQAKCDGVRLSKTEVALLRFQQGLVRERPALRRHLTKTQGYKCACCGVFEWNGKPITLVVDHIDGNAGNNVPGNLRLLCPNCNSQTETFSGRNKGRGRKSRGLPLH
jgi:hypothetical protein